MTFVARSAFALSWALCALCAACGGQAAPMMPSVPADAVLDEFDAEVLLATSSQAPTFGEVSTPRDETPRRFRAWLGWTAPTCEPCPPDQTATCTPQCTPGKPFVCLHPSRTIACSESEIVSTRVSNGDDAVPAPGAYVLEGAWSPAGEGASPEFAVTRVAPLEPPRAAAE